jgi:hypothetical protein
MQNKLYNRIFFYGEMVARKKIKQTNKKCDCVNLPTTYKDLKA